MELFHAICTGATALLSVCIAYQVIYTILGFLMKGKTFAFAEKNHRFGIVIAARNESRVIGNLLESIQKQNYDMNLVQVFVVADNCDDNTAEICRNYGAIVYERFDKEKARKGYALEFLFDNIERDYGVESWDGFMCFDADNLLHPNFLCEINKAFATGAEAVVGYRNTKNFAQNFISAAYGIHFYRSTVTLHRPRTLLGLPTHIAGTGYVLRSHLLKNGWHYTTLTEDTQFTLSSVAKSMHIEFCEAAEFYDEQPYEFKVMFRQRVRWEKGRLVCFFKTAGSLFKGVFCRKGHRKRAACYDMFFYAFPKGLFSAVVSLLMLVVSAVVVGVSLDVSQAGSTLLTLGWSLLSTYLGFVMMGALSVIRERKHIKCSTIKCIWYVLAFPWFDLVGLPIAIVSLFMRVKWKPIKHDAAIKVEELVS